MNQGLDIDPLIRLYCEKWSTPQGDELADVEKRTQLNTVKRHEASDVLQGRLISFITKLIQPHLIVEIGTFTAYATACLAEGLAVDGRIITIEQNEQFRPFIVQTISQLNLEDKVKVIYGEAIEVLPQITDTIDLLLIDAAKYEYADYYDLTIDKVRSGGVILADNTLWKGRVLDKDMDNMTQAMHDFNKKMKSDDRVEVVIFPYRDGMSLIRKK